MSREETVTTVRLYEECRLKLYGSTFIGTREYQQDRMLMYEGKGISVAAVCDGMGGMESGERASQLAVDVLTADMSKLEQAEDISAFLREEASKINELVADLKDEGGCPIESGSTIVMIVVKGDLMYLMSAGDSRIYLMHDDKLMCLTKDHNYRMRLDEKLRVGMIDMETYMLEEPKAEALISFLGIGSSILIDTLDKPLKLEYGDRIILCSDGLYKGLNDDAIEHIALENQMCADGLADKLIEEALFHSPSGMDNTTVIVGIYE